MFKAELLTNLQVLNFRTKSRTMDQKDVDHLAAELYKLELDKRAIEERQKEIKEKVLAQMNLRHQDKLPYPDFTLLRSEYVRYDMPEASVVRKLLGKLADDYIKTVVDPKFRLALPPAEAEKFCPINKRTPYVALKMSGDANGG